MARKTGQIVGRGRHRWLVRVFLGRDRETRKRRYHSRIIRGDSKGAERAGVTGHGWVDIASSLRFPRGVLCSR